MELTTLNQVFKILFPSHLKEKSKIKETKVLVKGSQEGKIGPTHYEIMLKTFKKIWTQAEPGVSFNARSLENYLFGGTCSAMTFGAAFDFLTDSTEDLHERFIKVIKNYTHSSECFRAQQIAFNTIEKDKSIQVDDFKRAKIQSLANFYDLKLDYASEDLDTDFLLESPGYLQKVIEELPEGTYILRILRPSDNYKEERYGHTTLYIKNDQGDYFYDPNFGGFQIKEEDRGNFLISHLKTLKEDWLVTNPRFYRLKI